jgi:phosphoribosylanthranilate isomerase
MLVKVCGMKPGQNLLELELLKPEFIGFIFFDRSPRFVGEFLSPSTISNISSSSITTGVFVNSSIDLIKNKVKLYKLRAVQLHGDEDPAFCEQLKFQIGPNLKILKAFGVSENFDFKLCEAYKDAVDYFLFDTKTKERGGSGKLFDWQVLNRYTIQKPYFLSGGIGIDEIKVLKKEIKTNPVFKHLIGVDLNSKFEIEPGLKDLTMVKEALEIIRAT